MTGTAGSQARLPPIPHHRMPLWHLPDLATLRPTSSGCQYPDPCELADRLDAGAAGQQAAAPGRPAQSHRARPFSPRAAGEAPRPS
jgi:hypothetical protein